MHSLSRIAIELTALHFEAEGMKQENERRLARGAAPAYDESEFYALAAKARALLDELKDNEPANDL